MTFVPNSINCCCDWGTLLSNAIENQGLDQLQSWKILGLSGRADINLCSGWLYPGHFPLLPFFMGKSTLIHSEPCTVQHSAGNRFIPEDAAVTNKINFKKKKKEKRRRILAYGNKNYIILLIFNLYANVCFTDYGLSYWQICLVSFWLTNLATQMLSEIHSKG